MEVVEGKNTGNSDFRGVWIVKNGRMAKKNGLSGKTGICWRHGEQVSRLTDMLACIN
jgi:hypothetical protein